jgi:hypothetical protein
MTRENTRTFPIEELVLDHECQSRESIHNDVVSDYAEALATGSTFPPVDVWLVAGKPYVVDGFHRVTAHIKAAKSFVACRIVGSGTMDQASWHAQSANRTNGVYRSNADKRKSVRGALKNPIGVGQSNRAIADHCGVSDMLVADVRRELEPSCKNLAPDKPAKRTGKDGKSYATTKPKREKAEARPAPTPKPVVEESRVEIEDAEEAELPDVPKAAEVDEYADHLRLVRTRMRFAFRNSHLGNSGVFDMLKRAEDLLRMGAPVDCPTCNGAGGPCRSCAGRGWVTRGDARAITRTAS